MEIFGHVSFPGCSEPAETERRPANSHHSAVGNSRPAHRIWIHDDHRQVDLVGRYAPSRSWLFGAIYVSIAAPTPRPHPWSDPSFAFPPSYQRHIPHLNTHAKPQNTLEILISCLKKHSASEIAPAWLTPQIHTFFTVATAKPPAKLPLSTFHKTPLCRGSYVSLSILHS